MKNQSPPAPETMSTSHTTSTTEKGELAEAKEYLMLYTNAEARSRAALEQSMCAYEAAQGRMAECEAEMEMLVAEEGRIKKLLHDASYRMQKTKYIRDSTCAAVERNKTKLKSDSFAQKMAAAYVASLADGEGHKRKRSDKTTSSS